MTTSVESGTIRQGGVTAVVGGIVAHLPKKRVRAPSGAWHWAFKELRDRHLEDAPELRTLEFYERAGVWPVSEKLERILQIIDMAGTGSTLNPALLVRQFDKAQKDRLKRRLAPRLKNREQLLTVLAEELQRFLDNAPSTPPAS